jgi:chromosome segregation ATPase
MNHKVREVKDKIEEDRKSGSISSGEYEEKSRRLLEIEERLKVARDKREKLLNEIEQLKSTNENKVD